MSKEIEQARQMDKLFNPDPSEYEIGTSINPYGMPEKKEILPTTIQGRRAEELRKDIKKQQEDFRFKKDVKPSSLFEKNLNRWVVNPENLTMEDRIRMLRGNELFLDRVIEYAEKDMPELIVGDLENKKLRNSISAARNFYKANADDILSFNADEELKKIREQYKDTDEVKNYNNILRDLANIWSFEDIENNQEQLWLSDDKLTGIGSRQWKNIVEGRKAQRERAADNIKDLPRLAGRSIGVAARDIGALPDALGYIGGAAGNLVLHGAGKILPGITGEEMVSGYHNSGFKKTIDFLSQYNLPAKYVGDAFEALESVGESVLNADFMQYEGYLSENKRVANNLEMAGSLAVTLPFELAAVSAYMTKLSNPKVAAKLKELAQDPIGADPVSGVIHKINRANSIMADRVAFAGAKRLIEQEKRAVLYANVGIMGAHLGIESIETDLFPSLQDSDWWNGAKIPLYFGSAIFSAKFGPNFTSNVLNKVGLAERQGPASIMNQLKFYATHISKNGFRPVSVDEYLTQSMNYNPERIANMSEKQKYNLLGMTRKEYKHMEEFGIVLQDIRKHDIKHGTDHFDQLEKGIRDTIQARDDMLKVYADVEGYDDVDLFARENPNLAEKVDLAIEDMLDSESLRAAAQTLTQHNKLPLLGKFSAKTIYEDLRNASDHEIKRRQAFADVLNKIMPETSAEKVLDPTRKRFMDNLKNRNDERIIQAADRKIFGTKKLAEERERIAQDFTTGMEINKADYRLLGNRLDSDDIDVLNTRFNLFQDLGYTPKREATEAFAKIGLRFDRTSPVAAVKKDNPLVAYGKASRRVFDNAFNSAQQKIDDIYRAARESNENKYINVNEVDDTFQKVKRDLQDPSMEARTYGTNPNEYNNFSRFYYRVGLKWIDRAGKQENIQQLDTILKSAIKKPNMDEDQLLDALEEYKNQPKIAREDGFVSIYEADTSEYASHLKGLLASSVKEGNNFLAVGIDLKTLQEVRSNIMSRARENYGTVEGHQLSDLAEDLRIVLEVGSKKFMDTEGYTSFIQANKAYAEGFVPLFKQGAARDIAQKTSTLERKVPDAEIMSNFFLSKDKTSGPMQFRKIFGNDQEATDLMRQGIASHYDSNKVLDEDQLLQLLDANIISEGTYKIISPANIKRVDNTNKLKLDAAYKRMETRLKTIEDRDTQGILAALTRNQGETNLDRIYSTFVDDFTTIDLQKLLKETNKNNYPGGQKALSEDIVTLLAKPIVQRVTALGDKLGQDTAKLMLDADAKVDGVLKKAFRKKGKTFDNSIKGRAAWGAELDSRAFQQVLEEIAPKLRILDPKRYDKLDKLANFSIRVGAANQEVGKALGTVRSMSVESILSRVYSIQRGVVSTRYVASEATLQAFRENRMRLIEQMLNNPQAPDIILSVLYDNALGVYDTRMRWIQFIRGWTLLTGEEMSDEEITDRTIKAFNLKK